MSYTQPKINDRASSFLSGVTMTALAFGLVMHSGGATDASNDVVDLEPMLTNITTTSISFDELKIYAPPSDHTQARYNDHRANSAAMDDQDLLKAYRSRVEAMRIFRSRKDGTLPMTLAQNLADPAHAAWREIIQRGLDVPDDVAPFHAAWASLVQS